MSEYDTTARVLSVSELNRLARLAVERALPVAWISGEISNLTRAPSGHWYFTLKDASATVRCAMFRSRNQFVDWRPENGMQVEILGQATLYEARGEFQVAVEAMRQAGLGALYVAFQQLKDKLAREGLFEPARKRPLPAQPASIGVVTSPRGAALRDVLITLKRRWPLARVVLYPTLVQGAGASVQIAQALNLAASRRECDVLLVVRGGGGIEDLWAFNEEVVARAIAASPIPVVSGIGHETDFTIADFAADLRTPTPTGAAQLATPDIQEWRLRAERLRQTLSAEMARVLHRLAQGLDQLSRRLQHPAERLEARRRHLDLLARRLALAKDSTLSQRQRQLDRLIVRLASQAPALERHQIRIQDSLRRLRYALTTGLAQRAAAIDSLSSQLAQLNPQAVLERGYSIVRTPAGTLVNDSRQVQPGDGIAITLAQGVLEAEVRHTH